MTVISGKTLPQIADTLTTIPDNALFYAVWQGVDYKMTGKSLKAALAGVVGSGSIVVPANSTDNESISLGISTMNTGFFVDYTAQRGNKNRVGRISISVKNELYGIVDHGSVIVNKSDDFDTAGITFEVFALYIPEPDFYIYFLSVTCDNSDSEPTTFKYNITGIIGEFEATEPVESQKIFSGVVEAGAGALARVQHNKNIPVQNQGVSLTLQADPILGVRTHTNMSDGIISGQLYADGFDFDTRPVVCNQNANYFDVFLNLGNSSRLVQWILIDNR